MKPKILFISPCTPYIKGTGWEQRAFSFLSAYSNFLDIELWFNPTTHGSEKAIAKKLIDICHSVVTFKKGSLNYMKDAIYSRAVDRADFVHTYKISVIFEHKALLWDFDELPRQLILDPSGNKLEKIYVPEGFLEMRKKSKVAYSSSLVEKDISLGEVIEIPNVYDTNIKVKRNPDNNTILFVGNMSFLPNINAVNWFAKEVLPMLPKNMRLKVIGRRPNTIEIEKALLQLAANKNIDFIFDVNDCNPYYEQVLAAIVPILSGGGTKIKILEAFANRCPVISTSKGIEGLKVINMNQLLIANTATEFLDAILKLKKIQKDLTDSAYQYLLENHTQKIVEERILKSLSEKGF